MQEEIFEYMYKVNLLNLFSNELNFLEHLHLFMSYIFFAEGICGCYRHHTLFVLCRCFRSYFLRPRNFSFAK